MRLFLKILTRIAILLIIAGFFTKKYNQHCIEKESCQPFYVSRKILSLSKIFDKTSDLDDKSKNFESNYGRITVNLKTISSQPEIELEVDKSKLDVIYDQVVILKLTFTNHGEDEVFLKPFFNTEPRHLKNFVVLHQCLCDLKMKLKGGESKTIKVVFEIDSSIDGNAPEKIDFVYGI